MVGVPTFLRRTFSLFVFFSKPTIQNIRADVVSFIEACMCILTGVRLQTIENKICIYSKMHDINTQNLFKQNIAIHFSRALLMKNVWQSKVIYFLWKFFI